MTTAIYAFSGDPITYGHIDIIERASKVFDRVIVAIGENPDKKYTFNLREREEMARQCFSNSDGVAHPHIKVLSFSNLLVDFAYEQKADVIIKGVRNSADFNYENILHSVGQSQKNNIDTHILFADPKKAHISSSAVKEIIKHGGNINEYVPLYIKQKVEEKVCNQIIIGITGEIGAGKSYISDLLTKYDSPLPIHNIELDHIAHDILGNLTEPLYVEVRHKIAEIFGKEVLTSIGFINRKALGDIVFKDAAKLKILNDLTLKPLLIRLRKEISGRKGILLINSALLAEADMLHLCNNNIILIYVDKTTQYSRIMKRGYNEEQTKRRIECQYTYNLKRTIILNSIQYFDHGKLWTIDNSYDIKEEKLYKEFGEILKNFNPLPQK